VKGITEISRLIRQLYEIVAELEKHFPERRFTPDGHLVGSIGEVLAADYYGLKLLPQTREKHDAETEDGRLVQIKATQVSRVGLRDKPQHLIVLRILPNGEAEEVYNGPGELAWENAGKIQRNGQRPISLARLAELMESVPGQDRLPKVIS
jgi:hypothetical protein